MVKLTKVLKEIVVKAHSPKSVEGLKRSFESYFPDINMTFGKKELKGKGKVYSISNPNDIIADLKTSQKKFNNTPPFYDQSFHQQVERREINELKTRLTQAKKLSTILNITWKELIVLYYYHPHELRKHWQDEGSEAAIQANLTFAFYVKGETSQGVEVLYHYPDLYTQNDRKEVSKLLTPGDIAPVHINRVKKALFPQDSEDLEIPNIQYKSSSDFQNTSKEDKEVVKDLRQNPSKYPNVEMQVTKRIKREGPGIKGSYQDLAKHLSKDAQANLVNYGNELGVDWKNTIVFTNKYGNLYHATEGFDKDGRRYVFYKGDDGYSKIRGPL